MVMMVVVMGIILYECVCMCVCWCPSIDLMASNHPMHHIISLSSWKHSLRFAFVCVLCYELVCAFHQTIYLSTITTSYPCAPLTHIHFYPHKHTGAF